MPFNVSTFKSQIAEFGYLPTNKFQVVVVPPPMFDGESIVTALQQSGTSISEIIDQLRFRTEDVIIPSVVLNTVDVYRYGIGPFQKQPVNAAFNTLSLTFISDGYGDLWQFWYQWIYNIFGFSPSNNGQGGIINTLPTLTLNYKKDYSTTITVFIYDQFGNIAQTMYFNQAFPVGINDVRMNWGLDNQLLKITIDVAFTNYIINGSSVTGVTLSSS